MKTIVVLDSDELKCIETYSSLIMNISDDINIRNFATYINDIAKGVNNERKRVSGVSGQDN